MILRVKRHRSTFQAHQNDEAGVTIRALVHVLRGSLINGILHMYVNCSFFYQVLYLLL